LAIGATTFVSYRFHPAHATSTPETVSTPPLLGTVSVLTTTVLVANVNAEVAEVG